MEQLKKEVGRWSQLFAAGGISATWWVGGQTTTLVVVIFIMWLRIDSLRNRVAALEQEKEKECATLL